jgi:hypothetical protein
MRFHPFINNFLDIACSWFEVITLAHILFTFAREELTVPLIILTLLSDTPTDGEWIVKVLRIKNTTMMMVIPCVTTTTD